MARENKRSLPKFPNGLRIPGEGEEFGYYLPLLDTLLIPIETWDVRRHEVAHRAFAHLGWAGSDFSAMRRLVGMSHALLSLVPPIAYGKKVFISGKQFGELSLSGESSWGQSQIMKLLQRTEYIENIIDTVWSGLEAVAEFAAIDFAEGVDPRDSNWIVQRRTGITRAEREEIDREKLRLIKLVANKYPKNFGDYHTQFGSFQEAFLHAWEKYNQIEDDIARKELLRLSMSSLYFEDDKIKIRDPLSIILNRAEFAQQHSEEAKSLFFNERQVTVVQAFRLTEQLEKQLFYDIDSDRLKAIRNWLQLLWEILADIQEKGGFPGSALIYDVVDKGNGPWYSFLRFVTDSNEEAVVHINSLILDAIDQRSPGFSEDWLSMLLVGEMFRQALKTGDSMICPFQGWEKRCESRQKDIACNKNCYIRNWLKLALEWCEFVNEDAVCDTPEGDEEP